jgi:uncharacterized membrane protein YfcA
VALLHVLVFVVLGGVFGFTGGLFGIGGAFLAIPILGIVFGMSEQLAQGTALAMAVPNVAVGLWSYARNARLDWRIAAALAATALPFTFVCARVATALPSKPLRIGFAVFLIVVALDLARRTFLAPVRRPALAWPWATVAGACGGVFSGFFGLGGAILTVPAMTMFFGLSQLEAQGMSLAFSAPTSVLTTATYAAAGDVDWAIGIPLAAGGVFTISLGVRLARTLPERMLKMLFIGFVVVVAIALMLKARAA